MPICFYFSILTYFFFVKINIVKFIYPILQSKVLNDNKSYLKIKTINNPFNDIINKNSQRSSMLNNKSWDNLTTNKPLIIIAIFAVISLWGANFVVLKVALLEFNAYELLFYRIFVTAIILSPFIKKPDKRDFLFLLLSALALVIGHFIFLFLALKYTNNIASISLVTQLHVPFSLILSWIFFKDSFSKMQTMGLIISFIGIIILFYTPSMFDNIMPLFFGLISAFSLGVYAIFVKKIKHISSIGIIAYIALMSTPIAYIIMLINGDGFLDFLDIEKTSSWLSFLFATFGVSIIAHSLWAWLVKHQDISFISPFILLVPMVSVFFAWIIFDEVLTMDFAITSIIVIFGLLLIFLNKKIK